MKKALSTLFAILSFLLAGSAQQNMVPNGDFEFYSNCPTAISQVDSCIGWRQWSRGTSDYYNACSQNAGVPANFAGYQYPHSGNAYMGCANRITSTQSPIREYITRDIIPLKIGVPYEVSISVNLSNYSQ